jgi:hypothetical protein
MKDHPLSVKSGSSGLSHIIGILTTTALLSMVAGCGASLTLTSEWTDQEVHIDGQSTDWANLPTRIAGPDVHVGVKNDKDNLYICLSTSSRPTQSQMLGAGTTVWFDTEGQKNRTHGIRFPLAGALQRRRLPSASEADEMRRIIDGLNNVTQRQFEIIGPGPTDRKRVTGREARGIDLHLGYADGTLTYELKVPLHRSSEVPYALSVDPAKPLMIGLETGDYAAEATSSQTSATGRVGGASRSGGRGGRGGGGSTPPGMAGGDAPEPLKHWLTVHLAGGPAAPSK